MKKLFEQVGKLVDDAKSILIIQAENPDGDSLGSAIALEQIFAGLGKDTFMYCPVQIPGYLRYMQGWSRVEESLPDDFDLTFIVDTSSTSLLERVFEGSNLSSLEKRPLIVLDHHDVKSDLPIEPLLLNDSSCVATGELVYDLALANDWEMNFEAQESVATAILADSLGLMSEGTTAKSIQIISKLVSQGVKLYEIDEKRREYSKKTEDIFRYKGHLFERAEFHLDGQVGIVVIPWEDIQKYSDAYNPSMLIIDEMRMVEGVKLAAAFKMYPDGKITCKIRANSGDLHANRIAEKFGGGGHPYAAGFKVRDKDYPTLKKEFLEEIQNHLKD